MGLYTDDSCTNFADTNSGRTTYKSLAGTDLPYATTSLINSDCVSCIEVQDLQRRQDEVQDDAYGDDAEDADVVSEQCERLYQSSGKCEMSLSSNSGVESPNNNACSYIGGIQFTKLNGVVVKKMGAGEKANVVIGLFAIVFVGMAAVVYKLRTSELLYLFVEMNFERKCNFIHVKQTLIDSICSPFFHFVSQRLKPKEVHCWKSTILRRTSHLHNPTVPASFVNDSVTLFARKLYTCIEISYC